MADDFNVDKIASGIGASLRALMWLSLAQKAFEELAKLGPEEIALGPNFAARLHQLASHVERIGASNEVQRH